MAYQMEGSACPRCGGTAEVRSASDLFGALSAASDTFQRFGQPAGDPQFGQPAGQPQFGQPAGQPQFGQPAGQPQFGQPAGQPQYGQPAGQHPGAQPPGAQPGQPGQPDAGPQDGPGSFGPSPFGPNPHGPQDPAGPGQAPAGQDQGQGRRWGRRNKDDDYDHYNVEGANRGGSNNRSWRDLDPLSGNIVDDIGGVVADAALGFAGRTIGRRMMKAFEERVIPAVQARAAQAQQQFGQQRGELDAIAARYPELRGCLKDQVVFVAGGTRTVQFNELTMPLTLAQADAVVARLR